VGRGQELAVLRSAVEALHDGAGSVIWVEGEPGIGKSSLVTEALADCDPRWDTGWGMADQLTERLPLRVIRDCLQLRPGSPDPRRARAAELLLALEQSLLAGGEASAAGLEVVLTLVDELCAAAPAVLVLDDLQWADEASLLVWHQLAASVRQLPLLLVSTCRPTPRRPEVQQVRAGVSRRGGEVITLTPLPPADVTTLVTAMVGAPPGDGLGRLTARAAGNPLYVRELIDALLREHAVGAEPLVDNTGDNTGGNTAELALAEQRLPATLAEVLTDRLSSVSPAAAQLLRAAALLGGRFTATDLAVVLRQPASDLSASLQETLAAGILADSGAELVFRHPLLRQALYESLPLALRTALHLETARELASAGADPLSVAQQLSAARQPGESWAVDWLLSAAPGLTARAPALAEELLQRALDAAPGPSGTGNRLLAALLRAQLAVGSYQEAARRASAALTMLTDPGQWAETSWMLARSQVSIGASDSAIATIERALAVTDLPVPWRARILALLPMLQRVSTGDLPRAEATAREALALAEQVGDALAAAHALADLWLISSVRRDHVAALGYLDRALRMLGDDPAQQDMRLYMLNVRIFARQNLAQWPQAELALREARAFALQTGIPDRSTWANAAVLGYWGGHWDDALAELGPDDGYADGYLRERWPALHIHGVTALIAGRREEHAAADEELRKGLALPIENLTDRENQDFLRAAHTLALEQQGKTAEAMARLAAMLPRGPGEMTLTHQWLPDLVRLALATGDREMAQTAAWACQAEAAAETRPARAAVASLRCQGLLESDPGPLREAVAHYRTVGPAVELPAALEDLAVVLAAGGAGPEARTALHEAIGLYEGLQASWDIRRADSRLRPYGIGRGGGTRRARPAAFGWAALTPTEVKIAMLLAQGNSTTDIAQREFLSRRTVQTYISRILTKLGAKSRVEIAREALRQDA
jgi:DNA-binding CsgD family transcriptional regulator